MTESEHQIKLFEVIDLHRNKYPGIDGAFHIPNGGHRSKAVAGKLKAEGVRAGVPDIYWPQARGGYFGFFLELKAEGKYPTKVQHQRLNDLTDAGYFAEWCQGWHTAWELFKQYAELPQTRIAD